MPSYKRLLTASAKGGVGKSTTAVGLAHAFASSGSRVLLIDLDCTGRCLDILTDCSSALFHFGDVVTGTDPSDAAAKEPGGSKNLSLIAACTTDDLAEAAKRNGTDERTAVRAGLERIFETDEYDIIIADTGGGITAAEYCADMFDMILVTSEQSKTSVRAAEYAAGKFSELTQGAIRLVICSFDLSAVKRENRAGIIEMIDASSIPCIGVVPYDKTLQKNQDSGRIPPKKSLSQKAYTNIAERIRGNEVPLFYKMKELYRKRNAAL